MSDHPKSPFEQAVDLFVFAPVGLAMTARENLPALVEKGRQTVTSRVVQARTMGRFAAGEAEREVRRRIEAVTEGRAERAPAGASEAPSNGRAAVPVGPSANGSNGSNGKARVAGPAPSSDHLAIPGYDTLAASQVVQRLAGLSGDELEAVRDYEAATRGRRTILTKIAQLQSAR